MRLCSPPHKQLNSKSLWYIRYSQINISNIFKIAARDNIPTWRAADRMGEERIAMMGRIKQPFMNQKKVLFSGRVKNANHD